jgi:hypothetical protein
VHQLELITKVTTVPEFEKVLYKVGDKLYQCDHKTASGQPANVPPDTSLGFLAKRVSKPQLELITTFENNVAFEKTSRYYVGRSAQPTS